MESKIGKYIENIIWAKYLHIGWEGGGLKVEDIEVQLKLVNYNYSAYYEVRIAVFNSFL